MLVIFVQTAANVAALEEEHMACSDQQHSEKKGQSVVVVMEDLSISDLDDSSNLDCICCLKGYNYFVVVGFSAEGIYYKCLQHELQVAH